MVTSHAGDAHDTMLLLLLLLLLRPLTAACNVMPCSTTPLPPATRPALASSSCQSCGEYVFSRNCKH
jgi:hypothetical protein